MDCVRVCVFLVRWSLQAVRWWAGWDENGTIETIVKHLLEEIEALECNFSGVFSPDRSDSIGSTFMGENIAITPSQLAHELSEQK